MKEADEELVDIFDTEDPSEAQAVRELLESGNIEVQTNTVALMGQIQLQVAASSASEASRLIADYQRRKSEEAERAAAENERTQENLVDVFDTHDNSEAMVVEGLLESGGIAVSRTRSSALPVGQIQLQVPESQAEEARQVIAEYRRQGPEDAERAERESEPSP